MYKGGGPTEQHVHHFNTSLEEIALGMCKGDAAEHTDFQDEECSRASKIKKQQEEGIHWKQQAIQDTLKDMLPVRDTYLALTWENQLLRRRICQLKKTIELSDRNHQSPAF